MKANRENKNTKETQLILGDYVLVRQQKRNKWSTPYEPAFYTVTNIEGSKVTARRATDSRTVSRDASQFKLANCIINTADETREKSCEENLSMLKPEGSDQPTQSASVATEISDSTDKTEEESKKKQLTLNHSLERTRRHQS
ncbi:uncharacterized protein LOC116601425 [Nematostella vectensis]|uniref:uncharacterized protein LOC116601425 n=1 Tax=Nematostella vectensis TaxID=45351 RepID=UPI0020773E2D|nr:uncharacterized protein LOC116601425 [Nematostella vectensis]